MTENLGKRQSSTAAATQERDLIVGKKRKEESLFNDPIHGSIELPVVCVRIINTPEFQRLKNIKQLGGAYFVYPGASHNRFEHSVGVCHLAGELMKKLRQQKLVSKETDELDVLCVQIAGLCHDLGHGPYSHLFDKHFYPAISKKKWKHEEFSKKIALRILKKLEENEDDPDVKKTLVAVCSEEKFKLIENLIDGDCPHAEKDKVRKFLYDIVANKRNGVDVDKWDYFARDCHYLGLGSTFDYRRLIKFARVIADKDGNHQICYRDKEAYNLYEMFHVRDILYRRAYCHKTTLIIEHMLAEVLVYANNILKVVFDSKQPSLKKCIDEKDIDTYLKLDDSIFWLIQHWSQMTARSSDPEETAARDELDKASALFERVITRKHYRYVTKKVIKGSHDLSQKLKEKQTEWNKLGEIQEADYMVKVASFEYFKQGQNPVDNVRFFRKEKPDEAVEIKLSEVSLMLSETFTEHVIYLYDKADQPLPDETKLKATETFNRVVEELEKEVKSHSQPSQNELEMKRDREVPQ